MKTRRALRLCACSALLGIAVFLAFSFRSSPPLAGPPAAFQPGDVLLIEAGNFLARTSGGFSGGFGHIVVLDRTDDGRVQVIHAAPNAPSASSDSRDSGVRVEDWSVFAQHGQVTGWMQLRFVAATPGQMESILDRAHRLARSRVPFDFAFDRTDSAAVYCTEFVEILFQDVLATSGEHRLAPEGKWLFPDAFLSDERFLQVTPNA